MAPSSRLIKDMSEYPRSMFFRCGDNGRACSRIKKLLHFWAPVTTYEELMVEKDQLIVYR